MKERTAPPERGEAMETRSTGARRRQPAAAAADDAPTTSGVSAERRPPTAAPPKRRRWLPSLAFTDQVVERAFWTTHVPVRTHLLFTDLAAAAAAPCPPHAEEAVSLGVYLLLGLIAPLVLSWLVEMVRPRPAC